MIYLDSSVVLAHFFVEARRLPDDTWHRPLTSSQLLEYEVWTRLHAKGLAGALRPLVLGFFRRIALVGMEEHVLERAREPFPTFVRTLDGLHLATMDYLRQRGASVELATFDTRLIAAARALGIAIYEP
jgi:hypothetical protein